MQISRRAALTGAAALTTLPIDALATTATKPAWSNLAPGKNWTSEFLDYDPTTNFRQAMRLQRSLYDQDDILHWYHFIMVAVTPSHAPVPIVRWEGIEFSRHERIAEDVYRMHGHNLSFPRDLDTGDFTNDVYNPVTEKRVQPTMLALTGDPGLLVSPAGIITLDHPEGPFRPRYIKIRREGDFVKVDGIRVPPASWPVTFLEMGYEHAPAELYDDPSQLWLPTEVSGAYVFPYPDWMEMGDAPGHMFAAWSGYKLRSVDQLPQEFYQKAEAERPDLLKVDRLPFAKPIVIPSI